MTKKEHRPRSDDQATPDGGRDEEARAAASPSRAGGAQSSGGSGGSDAGTTEPGNPDAGPAAPADSDAPSTAREESAEEGGIEPGQEVREDGSEVKAEAGAEVREAAEPEGKPQQELETLQGEIDQLRDQHLRLAADFENYRKRVSADLAGGWIRAQAELVRSLVEGLDDLQRVSQFTSEDTTVDALIEGVDLVERKLLKALGDAGLAVLDPVGDRFDPNTMEAMMRVPAEEEGQDETVHQVFQKGYMFKDQLVRPARVSVFKDDD